MSLNITKLANWEGDKAQDFLGRINSKLMMDVKTNQFAESTEWIDMVEFTLPYLEKALIKKIRQIITEEEVINVELIKKVSVDSVKHLTKNVNFVEQYDEDTGEVIPKKILNSYKEETYVTYENRFLYTLINLIDDFMYLREKKSQNEVKGKNYQRAAYQAATKLKDEKIRINIDYSSEVILGAKQQQETTDRINNLKKSLKMLKNTDLYQHLENRKVALIKPPLKMTNVFLKNVNFQYAVKLWNYLNDQLEMKNKVEKINSEYEETGKAKLLIDEDAYLMHLVFKNRQMEEKRKKLKKAEQEKATKELTDALIERIIDLNPELSDAEINKLIADKYLVMKTRNVISLKPIEDKFRKRIQKYMTQVKEVRLK